MQCKGEILYKLQVSIGVSDERVEYLFSLISANDTIHLHPLV